MNISLFKVFCLVNEPMKPVNNSMLLFTPTAHSNASHLTSQTLKPMFETRNTLDLYFRDV